MAGKYQFLARISVCCCTWSAGVPVPHLESAGLKRRCVVSHATNFPSASGPRPLKNTIFSAGKWQKIANFHSSICVFRVRVVSLWHSHSCLRVLDSNVDAACAIEPIQQVFQGRHPKKKAFITKKRPKYANLGPKSVLSGSGWSVHTPPTLLCVCCTQNKMCGMPSNPFNKCSRAATTKKAPFSARKWPKNANFYAKSGFPGSRWSVGTPTLD